MDNHLYFAGHDLSDDGKAKRAVGLSMDVLGAGGGYEKTSVSEKGKRETESTNNYL